MDHSSLLSTSSSCNRPYSTPSARRRLSAGSFGRRAGDGRAWRWRRAQRELSPETGPASRPVNARTQPRRRRRLPRVRSTPSRGTGPGRSRCRRRTRATPTGTRSSPCCATTRGRSAHPRRVLGENRSRALTARTRGEPRRGARRPARRLEPQPQVARRRARRWIVAVMGAVGVQGAMAARWPHVCVALMGQCHLDLQPGRDRRSRDRDHGASASWDEIEIVVPEGIDVELTGLSIMGQRSLKIARRPGLAGLAPAS